MLRCLDFFNRPEADVYLGSEMAIEDGLFSLLLEAPATALSEVLRRRFALSQEAADNIAMACVLALILGLCFLAWFVYSYQ